MKNMVKLIGIIALVAVIGFSMAACKNEPADPAHNHDWGLGWQVTAATCIATGSQTRTCSLDATHTETEEIPIDLVDGHDYSDWTGDGICETAGEGTRVCSRSATHTETKQLDALGHNYEYAVTTPATCTAEGEETGTCTRDQATTTRAAAINPAAHNWEQSEGTAPTCTADGNGVQICSHNNEHTQSGVLPALGHDYEYAVTTAPTCTTAGIETGTCTRDQVTATRAIAINPTAHNWGNWTEPTTKTGNETIVCQRDGTHTETRVAMVSVPGGSFRMGQKYGTDDGSNETPVHTVTLTSFHIGKYEVTQTQWQAVMGRTQQQQQALTSDTTNYGRSDNRPIYYVSWYEALVFCNKLSISEGLTPAYSIRTATSTNANPVYSTNPDDWGTVPTADNSPNKATWDAATVVSGSTGYRLPTEAQWEYAAKGGDPTAAGWIGYTYAGSDTVGNVAWYFYNNGDKGTNTYGAKAVGTKAANRLGIYDMSGNVKEWCWDWYGNYTDAAQTDPTGASSGTNRVWRGGYWDDSASFLRSVKRSSIYPNYRQGNVGFRLARPMD